MQSGIPGTADPTIVVPAQVQALADALPVNGQISQTTKEVMQKVDEAKGATVHSFDPDATPAEKAAQTLKAGAQSIAPVDMSALPNLRGKEMDKFQSAGGAALATDVGTEKKVVAPTVGLKEIASVSKKEEVAKEAEKPKVVGDGKTVESVKAANEVEVAEGRADEDGTKSPPGAMPAKPTIREIPSWFAIGWTGQDKTLFLSPEDARNRSILSDFISDAYFGQWWHNAGIIIFAVLASHFITLLGGGWAWLIIILSFTASFYQASIRKTRQRARDDMSREVEKKGLRTDVESAAWINAFMQRFWLIYEPVLSATIVASVDQVLSVSCPAFLDSIRMTTFTLGTKPPHIDHVKTFPDTEDDIVLMEWKISFVPNDVLDMTHAAAAKKVNPKIVIAVGIGIGPAVLTKDIVVEDLMFTGTMRIKLKLMNNFPHVKTVDLSFMQPPVMDFSLNPIGFDLSMIPSMHPFIMSQVHGSLAPMMYDPNTFTLNLEQMLSGAPIDTACGVLALTIYNGRGMKATKLGAGAPDPYVSVSIAGRAELAKTAIKRNTGTPSWNETKYLLLNNLNEMLTLAVMDWNEHRPDSNLGTANFDLKSLEADGQQEGVNAEVKLEGKPRGMLKFDAIYYPVLVPKKLPDGSLETIPETKSGVVRLVIHQAKDLDPRGQQINPFFNVTLNDKPVHRSQTLKRTPNPIWERPCEFLVTEKSSAVIGIAIKDENSMVSDSPLGVVKVKLTDIFAAKEKEQDWFPLSGVKSGRVRISADWKPVLMAGAINGAGAYTAPIGVVRLYCKRAIDLKNVEALTGGKSDPYLRVLSNGIVVARTLVIDNDLDPVWDEIIYIEVHNPKDRYTLEVMDYQHMTKDRTLGSAELNVADLLVEGTDKKLKPWLSTGKHSRREMLKSDGKKTVKGTIELEAEFFPCAHLKSVSFSEPESDAIKEEDEDEEVEEKVEVKPVVNGKPGSVPTTPIVAEKEKPKVDPNEGIVIPREELLKTQSGILAFQIVSGSLSRKGARLEVLFDDGYWPAYSTEPARSPHAVWDEIGETFIRELDYSQIILKLNTAEKETREDVIASATIDLNQFLETCLDKPATFTLTDPAGGNRSTVTIAAKYIPVDIQLEARESVNNSGHLRVDLFSAKGIPAADRSGKSDPYAVFELNDKKVFKSQVIKKTLSPTWNENFEMDVPSRVAAKFFVDVYDWDRVGTATKLGRGTIDLAGLEPMESMPMEVALRDVKTGKDGGTVLIKLLFRPAFLARSRQATSTFSSAGRVASTLGGGVGAVGGGIIGVGGSVGKAGGAVGKGVFGGLRKIGGGSPQMGHQQTPSIGSMNDIPPVPAVPAAVADSVVPPSPALNGSSISHTSPGSPSMVNGASTSGTLQITVASLTGAVDAEEKKAVTVKSNGKTVETTHAQKGSPAIFNQTFTIKTLDGAPSLLEFNVVHKKMVGADKILGTATLNPFDHISPLTSPTTTVQLPISGEGGQLSVSLSWSAAARGAPGSPLADDSRSIAGSTSPSTRTKSRFSSNRFSMHRSRETSAEP